MSYRHLAINFIVLTLYFIITFLGSLFQGMPVYGDNLGYYRHNNFNFAEQFDLVNKICENEENMNCWANVTLTKCRYDTFKSWEGKNHIDPDWR